MCKTVQLLSISLQILVFQGSVPGPHWCLGPWSADLKIPNLPRAVLQRDVDSPTRWLWRQRMERWSRRWRRGRCWCPSVCRRTAARCPCGWQSSRSRRSRSCSPQEPAGPRPAPSACSPGNSVRSGICRHQTYLQRAEQQPLYRRNDRAKILRPTRHGFGHLRDIQPISWLVLKN